MTAWRQLRQTPGQRPQTAVCALVIAAGPAPTPIVFGVDRSDGRHIPGADISTHLAHHGVRAEARHTQASFGIHTGDVLLSEIGDHGIGLLVMGGYGHHRLRGRLFGGVTHDILRETTVPVLMAH